MGKRKKSVSIHPAGMLLSLKRWVFFILFFIAYTAFTIILIMGEDVFWRLGFIDQWYTNFNTNTGDVWIFVEMVGFVGGISLMILWNAGILGWLSDWAEANL